MSSNSSVYYSWHPPLFHKTQRTSFQYPLFFINPESSFKFQLKTLRCFFLRIAQNPIPSPAELLSANVATQSSSIASPITDFPLKMHNNLPSDVLNPAPCLSNLEHHQSIYDIFHKNFSPKYSFAYYAEAQLHYYGIKTPKNLAKALTIYQKGCDEIGELGCIHEKIRLHVEPDLADQFATNVDLIQALRLFIKIFLKYGLFDYFSTREPSLKHYALFNVYMDIFPEFNSLVLQVVSSSIDDKIWDLLVPNTDKEYKVIAHSLLKLLSQEDPYGQACIQTLQLLQSKADESNFNACFLLADLFDTSLYGISISHYLERRLTLYSKAEAAGNIIAGARLFSLLKTLERSSNEISHPSCQSSEYYYNKLKNFQGIDHIRKEAQELVSGKALHMKLEEVQKKHEILFYLDDYKTISNYFRILKFLKSPRTYEVAKTIREKKIGLYEIPWAYCYEKGIGVPQDSIKALQIYQEAFEKVLTLKNESKSFLYYRMAATILRTEAPARESGFFFAIAASDLILHLNQEPANIGLLYELSKLLLKGRGVNKLPDMAIEVLEHVITLRPCSTMDNFTLLYARRKLDKLKNQRQTNTTGLGSTNVGKPSALIDNKLNIINLIKRVSSERLEPVNIAEIIENGALKKIVLENLQYALQSIKPAKKTDTTSRLGSQYDIKIDQSRELDKNLVKKLFIEGGQNDTQRMESPNGRHNISVLPTPPTFLITELKQKGLLQRDLTCNERVQVLLEHHKKKSYNLIAQKLTVSDKVKVLLTFLKLILSEYISEESLNEVGQQSNSSKSALLYRISHTIQDVLQQLAAENNIVVLNLDQFEISRSTDNSRTLATHTENGQLFELVTQSFSFIHAAELLSESPTLFYLPLYFLHPQFFPIYGLCFTYEQSKMTITYLVEPKKASLTSYLASNGDSLKTNARISFALQALYTIHAFHALDIPLLTLSSKNFAITADGELKLLDLFLPLFEPSSSVQYQNHLRSYDGPLRNISPDIFRTNGRMSIASDIFCFGLMLYELMTGETLYDFLEFQNELDYCEKIKGGFFQQRISELNQKRNIQFPANFQDLILSCLSFHKKKRPPVEQLILVLQSLQQTSPRGIFEVPYSLQSTMEKQYRALQFSTSIDEDNCFFLLPGFIIYKGQTARKVPHGDGELVVFGSAEYKGKFQKGLLTDKATVHLVKRKECFFGQFRDGFPVQGVISPSENEADGEKMVFEERSWIPNEEYRSKIMKGFGVVGTNFLEYVRFRKEKLFDDNINFETVSKYVLMMLKENISRTQKANIVDCFGNFFYLKTPNVFTPSKISSYIVKSGFLTENITKVYESQLKEGFLFQADLSGIDLYNLKGKSVEPTKYPILSSFEEMVRYFHFGYKYLGRMENGNLRKGIVHIDYLNYFWYETPTKLYQGANFNKKSNCLYVGNILKNKADGFGAEYIGSVKRYEGEYCEGYPHGRGIIYNDNGKVEFIGVLSRGKPHYGLYYEGERLFEGRFTVSRTPEVEESKREISRDDYHEKPTPSPWTIESDLNFNSKFLFIIPTEIHKQRPNVKVITSLISEEITKSEDDIDDKPQRTEFDGSVRNFSENVKEIKGKLIMEDKKFNGNFKVLYADGSVYDGHLRNGARYGLGTFKMNNGSLFTGLWDHGRLKGKIIWGPSSKVLEFSEGEFIRERNGNTRHNNFGRLKFKNGDFYEGEILNGLMEGFGTFYFRSGEIYEGMMKNNKPEGIGKLWTTRELKKDYYEGQFKDGKREGYGIVYSQGEAIFKGKFEDDKAVLGRLLVDLEGRKGSEVIKHQKGIKTDASGQIGWYVGHIFEDKDQLLKFDKWGMCFFNTKLVEAEYVEGKLKDNIAKVQYYDSDKETTYFGEMQRGMEHGLGRLMLSKNNIDNEIQTYEGQFANGKRKGIGKFVYYEGDEGVVYNGDVDHDREGFGEWMIDKTTIYRGEFKNNVREGRGILIKDGRSIIGQYHKGKVQQFYYGR